MRLAGTARGFPREWGRLRPVASMREYTEALAVIFPELTAGVVRP